MSNSTFLPQNTTIPLLNQNPNPPTCYTTTTSDYLMDHGFDLHHQQHQDFDLSYDHYLALLLDHEQETMPSFTAPPCDHLSQSAPVLQESSGSSFHSLNSIPINNHLQVRSKSGLKRVKKDVASKITFRTKSKIEIMDDGFKWRKYGKKMVKDSPYPRNYYKCSTEGCNVKKRVEKDKEDSSYVITTYDGRHNHESPCVIYYNQMPLGYPPPSTIEWTLQASHSSSS